MDTPKHTRARLAPAGSTPAGTAPPAASAPRAASPTGLARPAADEAKDQTMPGPQRPFRALVLDGGGMRGLYVATLLQSLLGLGSGANAPAGAPAATPDLGQRFDLMAGTSTGGLLAATLAYGCSLEDIIDIYKNSGQDIFPHPLPDYASKHMNSLAVSSWAVRFRDRAPGEPAALRAKLEEFLGATTLRQLWEKKRVALCIPVTNVSDRSCLVFKTPHAPDAQEPDTAGHSLVDVCMATAAAPVLFPLVLTAAPGNAERTIACTDGGLWANSPVLIALLEALKLHQGRPIEIVVIGSTGLAGDMRINPGEENWGLMHWTSNSLLLELAMESQSQGYYQMTRALIPYLKVEPAPIIVRLPYSFPSSDDVALFGMDKANPKAQEAMQNKGREDARRIYEKMLKNEDDLGVLAGILKA